MRRVNPEKFAERRDEILAAAGRCFVRSGFHGASISAICKEASISPGHLYHYFKSKEEIVCALVEAEFMKANGGFNRLIDQEDIVGALLEEIESILREAFVSGTNATSIGVEAMAEARRNSAISAIIVAHSKRLRGLAVALFERAQASGQMDCALAPEAAATVLFGLLDGAMLWPVRNPEFQIEENICVLKTMFARLLIPAD